MVVAGCRLDLIAATERVLANQLRRYVCVARLCEVTKSRSANEAAFALWIEPTDRLAIRNYWGEWCARLSAFTRLAAALLSTTLATTLTAAAAALSASALIATAPSVVAIVAMAVALMLSLPAATTAT